MKTWEHHEYHVPHTEPWVPPLLVPPRLDPEPDPVVEAAVNRSRASNLKNEKIRVEGPANAEENKKRPRRRKPFVV
jgi:hypothetical protein